MSRASHVLRNLLVLLVLVILVALGVYLYENSLHNTGTHSIVSQKATTLQAYVALGYSQMGPLYSLNISNSSSTPVIYAPPAVGTSTVLDMASDETNTYYDLTNDALLTSDLYSADTNTSNSPLARLTNSPSLKFQLSYDAPYHTLAYVSAKLLKPNDIFYEKSWMVTVMNTITGATKQIGSGTHPIVLPGGIMVIVDDQNALSVINVISGVETKLLTLGTNVPYAIASSTLAVYNPSTKNIDYYDMKNITSVSYLRSQPVQYIPTTLSYDDGKLYSTQTNGVVPLVFTLQEVGSPAPLTKFSALAPTIFPQKLIIP